MLSFGDPRLPARFWAKVRTGSIPAHRPDLGSCWQWTAARFVGGYGLFHVGSRIDGSARPAYAHRFAYEVLIGPIPKPLEPDHLCRNRACVCPTHLEPVTRAVNTQRGDRAKLTMADIPVIRALRGAVSQRKLAARFSVSQPQIGRIQRGRAWALREPVS